MKKIFCIFAVVLILIMATVPCFAIEQKGFITLNNLANMNTVPYSDNGFDYVSDQGLVCISNNVGSSSLTSRAGWFGLSRSDHSVSRSLVFCKVIACDDPSFSFLPNSNAQISTVDGFVTFWYDFNSNNQFTLFLAPGCSISFYYVCFSLEDLGLDHSSGLSTVYDYISNYYDWSPLSYGKHTFYNHTAFNPLLEFYGSVYHVFDYFGNLISTHSILFVFFMSILFILMVIFIIACIFRRCRS